MKVTKLLTLDSDVVEKAKEMNLNVSAECNGFLRKRVALVEEIICSVCGAKEDKASKENNYVGMTLLSPDEKWICSECAKEKSDGIFS